MTTTLQALSLVEKAEPVQVRFTLRLRDQHRNAKLGDHGTLNAHNCWFILFHHVWGPAWTKFNLNNIWLRAWAYMASRDTWGSVTTLRGFGGVLGRPLETFFWALTILWPWLLACVWSYVRIVVPHLCWVILAKWKVSTWKLFTYRWVSPEVLLPKVIWKIMTIFADMLGMWGLTLVGHVNTCEKIV